MERSVGRTWDPAFAGLPGISTGARCRAAVVIVCLALCAAGCRSQQTPQQAPPASPPAARNVPPTADEFWVKALSEVYKSPRELKAQHEAELEKGIHYLKLLRGDPAVKQIALTFDDGPHPDYTPQLLAILARYKVKATFLLVGQKAEQAPDLVRQELAAGHSVGNHTYHHVNLTKIPDRMVAAEIQACGDVLQSITGRQPHLFRPPGGDYDDTVATTANGLGYTLVLWTDDPGDYARPAPSVIYDRTLASARNGGIILIHDGVQQTIEVLPRLIEGLRRCGLEFVTIDEMMQKSCEGVRPPSSGSAPSKQGSSKSAGSARVGAAAGEPVAQRGVR